MIRAARHDADGYTIRLFEPGDRDGYLALHREVLGGGSDEWFDWKYVDNPYADHVAVVVATDGDRVVGAKSGMGFEVGRGDERFLALQPGDTMVHPDHRRQGVYSRMTEFMKSTYADAPQALFFNYPNAATLPGSLKHGWSEVGTVTTRYRVADPVGFAGVGAGPLEDAVGRAGRAVAGGLLGVPRLGSRVADGLSVRRHREIPVATLADLYRRAVPDTFHVVRDETYLGWRYGNPRWEYTAYTVERGGRPVLGAVVGVDDDADPTVASVVDVLPMRGSGTGRADDPARRDAEYALFDRIVASSEAGVFAAADGAVSPSTAARFGFLPDTAPPLSWVATPSTLVAYPLDEAVDTPALASLDGWTLGLSDRDTR
ncbi:GNAT family N-acetyltransferase [Halobaculum lipolyticum]|uniref:GNAT family N-acetyltransferase n=1 Tax=Halobaculum lipolyticum TaxID=3032001 RepID=A0ABD5WKA3_9EURY|nr:GNAT family N-acetyltransferase [Halobaculum sp. DT31]